MRTKQIVMILFVLGLLATLTTSVNASTNSQASSPNLVGTWRINVQISSEDSPATFDALHSYFADGNFVEINTFKEANHGVWIGSGNTYLLTFEVFTFDENGTYNGKQKVRVSIQMDGVDHLTAQWVADTVDLEGKVTEKVYFGTYEGARMEAELPKLP